MKTEQKHPNRQSIRLSEYDYSQPGAYFVTINCVKRKSLFGKIIGEEVHLNQYGILAKESWQSIPSHFSTVSLDAFIIMPNHVHGILFINESNAIQHKVPVRAQHAAPPKADVRKVLPSFLAPTSRTDKITPAPHKNPVRAQHAAPLQEDIPKVLPGSLGAIIRSYKSAVTRSINLLRSFPDTPVWQRSYFERVIRDESELDAVRRYITYNALKNPIPALWSSA